ncbi:MAG TPA: phospholipase D-like domain-containing protein [bacterium]|nr:phospholipase D-like domain-containing protein [bacterium]
MRDFHLIFIVLAFGFSALSALHAMLHKRDPRAALAWILLALLLPALGGVLYWIFGINRIRTHAQDLHRRGRWQYPKPGNPATAKGAEPNLPPAFEPLNRLSATVTRRPLLAGNQIKPLPDGDEAYGAMLRSIEGAKERVLLSTYIFDRDATGREFVDALARAQARGALVRVLIDAFGAQYSFPQVTGWLKQARVPFSKFLPFSLSLNRFHPNLRNHRKLLLVDNQTAFTGGMNIGDRHRARARPGRRITDLHFELAGPILQELQDVFLEDWYFSTGETLTPQTAPAPAGGATLARAVSSGPNEDFEKLNWILWAALSAARRTVRLITPYFVPDRVMIAALNAAALRGVSVEVIVPGENNLPFVHWASRSLWWQMLEKGVCFHEQPPPFAHTKLMVVDGYYGLIGSSNWDARSFRLNFELDVETYGEDLGRELEDYFDRVRSRSRRITLEEMRAAPLGARLRDAFFKLFSPYL